MSDEARPDVRATEHFFPATGQKGFIGLFGYVEEKGFDDELRSASVTMTEESPDGVGDVVMLGGIDLRRFKANPVLLQFHDYGRWPLGKVVNVRKEAPRLRAEKVYYDTRAAGAVKHDDADLGWGLTRAGMMKGQSIGFFPVVAEEIPEPKDGESERRYYRARRFKKTELLELSDAPVPMHANALVGRDASYAFRHAAEDVLGFAGTLDRDAESIAALVKRLAEKFERDALRRIADGLTIVLTAPSGSTGPGDPPAPADAAGASGTVETSPEIKIATAEEVAELTASVTSRILAGLGK